jgi:hypothetical protein
MAAKHTKLYGLAVKPPDKIPDVTGIGAPAFVPALIQANPALVTSNGDLLQLTDQTKPAPLVGLGFDLLGNRVGIGVLRVAHAIYSFAVDGGAIGLITPVSTALIPANALIWGGVVNPTTAVLSAGALTMSVGTSAGSSAAALLAATAKASLSIDALLALVPTLAAPIKMSAAGNITVTIAAAAGTAGIVEIFAFYTTATNA